MAIPGPEKLTPLLRSLEAVENTAGEEFRRVSAVVEQRRIVYGQLQNELAALQERGQLFRTQRELALGSGDLAQVGSLTGALERLSSNQRSLMKSLVDSKLELERAAERLELAEQDLTSARVERKKIETLISQRTQLQRIRQSARDEAFNDEFGGRRRVLDRD